MRCVILNEARNERSEGSGSSSYRAPDRRARSFGVPQDDISDILMRRVNEAAFALILRVAGEQPRRLRARPRSTMRYPIAGNSNPFRRGALANTLAASACSPTQRSVAASNV